MTPYRVLITGSRTWADIDVVRDALVHARWDAGGPMVVVHGACRSGADAIASWWVRGHQRHGNPLEITEEPHPADWRYGKAAGPRRNAEMVALGAQLCLAFIRNSSRGATDCARRAEKAGIPVRRWTA